MTALTNHGSIRIEDFQNMTSAELTRIINLAKKESEDRSNKMLEFFNKKRIPQEVVVDLLFDLPTMEKGLLKDISTDGNLYKYMDCRLKPSDIEQFGAVKGIAQSGRPYVAMPVDRTNIKTQEISRVVEIVFDGFSGDSTYCANNLLDDTGKVHPAAFHCIGGARQFEFEALNKLLLNEEVELNGYKLKIHKKSKKEELKT